MTHLCNLCQQPVILVPSAEERAKKYGGTPDFYRSLFKVHSWCQIAANRASQLELTKRLVNERQNQTITYPIK